MNKNHLALPEYHIAGIGAIGTLIAASACRVKKNIQLILKNEKELQRYNAVSLRLKTDLIDCSFHPLAVSSASINSSISFLICCTKAYDIASLLSSLKHCLTPATIIILLHNGMGVIEALHNSFPSLRFISGITTLGGYLEQPYTVNAFLQGQTFLGATQGNFTLAEINKVVSFFNESFLACEWKEDVTPLMWDKFAINCSINLLTVLYSCTNGELLKHLEVLRALTREVVMVLNAYDVVITPDFLFEKVCLVLEYTADNYSSMYQDVKKKRMTEINYLNNHLISLAKQKDILIPLTISQVARFEKNQIVRIGVTS